MIKMKTKRYVETHPKKKKAKADENSNDQSFERISSAPSSIKEDETIDVS